MPLMRKQNQVILLLGLTLSLRAEPIDVSNLSTNYYTNILSTLKVTAVPGKCPECGENNHHEILVQHVETFYIVHATISVNGQTNPPTVIYTSPRVAGIQTNVAFRDWMPYPKFRQPGATNRV